VSGPGSSLGGVDSAGRAGSYPRKFPDSKSQKMKLFNNINDMILPHSPSKHGIPWSLCGDLAANRLKPA
jgi:hypothetical protein